MDPPSAADIIRQAKKDKNIGKKHRRLGNKSEREEVSDGVSRDDGSDPVYTQNLRNQSVVVVGRQFPNLVSATARKNKYAGWASHHIHVMNLLQSGSYQRAEEIHRDKIKVHADAMIATIQAAQSEWRCLGHRDQPDQLPSFLVDDVPRYPWPPVGWEWILSQQPAQPAPLGQPPRPLQFRQPALIGQFPPSRQSMQPSPCLRQPPLQFPQPSPFGRPHTFSRTNPFAQPAPSAPQKRSPLPPSPPPQTKKTKVLIDLTSEEARIIKEEEDEDDFDLHAVRSQMISQTVVGDEVWSQRTPSADEDDASETSAKNSPNRLDEQHVDVASSDHKDAAHSPEEPHNLQDDDIVDDLTDHNIEDSPPVASAADKVLPNIEHTAARFIPMLGQVGRMSLRPPIPAPYDVDTLFPVFAACYNPDEPFLQPSYDPIKEIELLCNLNREVFVDRDYCCKDNKLSCKFCHSRWAISQGKVTKDDLKRTYTAAKYVKHVMSHMDDFEGANKYFVLGSLADEFHVSFSFLSGLIHHVCTWDITKHGVHRQNYEKDFDRLRCEFEVAFRAGFIPFDQKLLDK